jgi:hypothetical protein
MRSSSSFRIQVILITLALVFCAYGQDRESVLLRYKFNEDQVLRYRTETHDTTESDARGQQMTNQTTVWSIQSISVTERSPDDRFSITLKTDSIWSDMDEPASGQGRTGGGRRGSARRGMGPRERTYEIRSDGNAESADKPTTAFLIPLPEDPISVNETWDYEINLEQRGRREGKTTIKGECLLYDLQKDNGSTIALIIVNSENTAEGRFNMQGPQGDVSGTFASSGSGTSLIYFDVDKGAVIEVISESVRESMTESTMFSATSSSKSNSTIRLMIE